LYALSDTFGRRRAGNFRFFHGALCGARFAFFRRMENLKFAIRNAGNERDAAVRAHYDSLEDARSALRELLGWPEVQLGPGYTTPGTDSQIWCAYRTLAEAEADPDGLNTPCIVRLGVAAEAGPERPS
jgi:hypothetical protein